MHDAELVAVLHRLEDLLDALRSVGLRVKFARDDVFEEFATGYAIWDKSLHYFKVSLGFLKVNANFWG